MKRLFYLDNLMIFLSILVVLHHVAIGYGMMGSWCYVSSEKITGDFQILLSALFGIEASFSMSLFFFISAYLTIPSLEKKGVYKFIKTRLIRLMIPLLFVMLVLSPSVLYCIELYNHSTNLSWFYYVLQQNISSPNTSHTWFILALIFFEIFYILYWKYIRPKFSISEHLSNNITTHSSVFIAIFLFSFFTIVLRQCYPLGKSFIGLEFANFIPYILMYSMGILVYRKHWLDLFPQKIAKTWFWASLFSAAYFSYIIYQAIINPPSINKFITGFSKASFSLAFTQTLICIGFCGYFLHLFRNKFNFSNFILLKMRENRYGVYIFHSVIVVSVTIALESVSLNTYFKFLIACVLSIILSYVFVGLIRNIPFIKKVI